MVVIYFLTEIPLHNRGLYVTVGERGYGQPVHGAIQVKLGPLLITVIMREMAPIGEMVPGCGKEARNI